MADARTSPTAGAVAAAPWDELRSIVGTQHLRPATAADAIRGLQPQMVIEPANENDLAAALRCANDAGLAVAPRGGGSKLAWGNPPFRADVVLSTSGLNRVLEHAWADLTVSVEAGCTIEEVQRTLAAHGQCIAVDPLFPERATVGGILSANDSGTLRLRFGALRDLVIGITLALPDGTLASSGGKVVKNVAGYDLPKLCTGALGTLGVITRAVFRLHPLPRTTRSFTFAARDLDDANRLILGVQSSQLAHTGLQARLTPGAAPAVDVRFEGTEAGLAAQTETLRRLAPPSNETESSDAVWSAAQDLWPPAETSAIAKLSILPTGIAAACRYAGELAGSHGIAWRAVVQGTGLGALRFDAPPDALHRALGSLRSSLERAGGSVVLLHRPAAMPVMDAWGSPGDAFPVMLAVKQQFDPKGMLNPGRFVGGI